MFQTKLYENGGFPSSKDFEQIGRNKHGTNMDYEPIVWSDANGSGTWEGGPLKSSQTNWIRT